MNTQTQNQNSENNYDFIVNQASAKPPKKRSGKLILIIVLVAATIVIVLAGLIVAPAENVQETGPTEAELGQQQTVKDFIALVDQGNTDAAYNMFVQSKPPISKEDFVKNALPLLKAMRLKECTYKTVDVPDATQETRPVVTCVTIKENVTISHEFQISAENPREIVNYRYVKTESTE